MILMLNVLMAAPSMAVDLPSTIKVGKWNGVGYDVYTLSLEEYLRGVAHHEMSFLRHVEAYKCQTVAARCYAATNMGKHGSFDVCNQTHCQRWEPDYDSMTDESVSGTSGQVVTCSGWGIITAWYSSHCDGHTRSSQEVWGGYRPWALSVSCPCGWTSMLGHGVGMCQYGAKAMADSGQGYQSILLHYYSNSNIEGGTSPPTPIPPPSAPDPSIQWLDQGVNSGNSQKVKVSCGMPGNATELFYDMEGAGANDYGWTGATSYTDTGVYDSQTVSVRCKARGAGGESGWSGWVAVDIGDRTAPDVPSPSIEWLDQGLNSRDTQKVKVSYGTINKVLVGRLPLRSMDNRKEYRVLNWTPKLAAE